jgi:hypothetical protein
MNYFLKKLKIKKIIKKKSGQVLLGLASKGQRLTQ